MQTIRDVDLHRKRALVRVDFDVPLHEDGSIANDVRVRAALPTLHHILLCEGSCVLMSHLDRPEIPGSDIARLRLDAVTARLAALLPQAMVRKCDHVVGERSRAMAEELRAGQVMVLENLRFHPGERAGDPGFAADLAALGDVYINDAFASCHRTDASLRALPLELAPASRAAGLLVEREIVALRQAREHPARPFVALIGGVVVPEKLRVVGALVERADRVLVGGAMSYAFMKARGQEIGDSRVDSRHLDAAGDLLAAAGNKLVLPDDHIVASDLGEPEVRAVNRGGIARGGIALDIGPDTVHRYTREIEGAATVLWHGPMGKIENPTFLEGTRAVVFALARADATTIIGGGETAAVVRRLGWDARMTHISTGSAAFLHYLATGTLPALEVL